jgi:hypothetical protein
VERALLLDRLLSLDPNNAVQTELRALAAANVEHDERLTGLAGGKRDAATETPTDPAG